MISIMIGLFKSVLSFLGKFKTAKVIKDNHYLDCLIDLRQRYIDIVNQIPQCLKDGTATSTTPCTNEYIKAYLGVIEDLLTLRQKDIIEDNNWAYWLECIKRDSKPLSKYLSLYFKHDYADAEITRFFNHEILNTDQTQR